MGDYNIVKNPSHYCEGKRYQPKFVAKDWSLDYYKGTALKYICRGGSKLYEGCDELESEIRDMNKAKEFLQYRIDELNWLLAKKKGEDKGQTLEEFVEENECNEGR